MGYIKLKVSITSVVGLGFRGGAQGGGTSSIPLALKGHVQGEK
jgi:hypothetical protein